MDEVGCFFYLFSDVISVISVAILLPFRCYCIGRYLAGSVPRERNNVLDYGVSARVPAIFLCVFWHIYYATFTLRCFNVFF